MIKYYNNVNANKLHDELIAVGIVPIFVETENYITKITFREGVDESKVASVRLAHDPTPIVLPPFISLDKRVAYVETDVDEIITVLAVMEDIV